jgi:DGQHR domain-containing protein
MSAIRIQAIKSNQNGNGVYSAKMSVRDLNRIAAVDAYDPESGNREGYQRKPNEKRYFEIANYMAYEKSMMPPAIVLSYRADRTPIKKTEEKGAVVNLEIPDDEKLWVIDGQHRLGGLRLISGLIKDAEGEPLFPNPKEEYQDFEMPVVIIESPDIHVEAYQFAKINSEAKKVNKYLANESILRGGGKRPEGKGAWVTRAVDLTKFMNEDAHSPLRGHLKHPNSPRGGEFYCSMLGFMNSLDKLLNDGVYATVYEDGGSDEIKSMLADYWSAWKEVAPFAFNDHKQYALFKNSGLIAANYCLLTILNQLGKRYPEKQDFVKILRKLGTYVSPEYWDVNNEEGMVSNLGKAQIINETGRINSAILAAKV